MATPRITSDPAVMMGKPVVAGTRITVEVILEKLAAGETTQQILGSYPRLTEEDIRAALAFAARSLRADVVYPDEPGPAVKGPERLFVMWIDPAGDRRRYVVGELWRERDGFAFGYDLDRLVVARKQGFVLFPEFPEPRSLEDPYRSRYLFASFAQRIPKPSRPDHARMMRDWGVDHPDDPLEVLARSDGVQMTDQIELSEYRPPGDALESPLQFRLAATKHFEDSRDLQLGQQLELVCEPDNPADDCAVLVTREGRRVGHVPRQYSRIVHDLLVGRVHLDGRVVRRMVLPDERGKWVVEVVRCGFPKARVTLG